MVPICSETGTRASNTSKSKGIRRFFGKREESRRMIMASRVECLGSMDELERASTTAHQNKFGHQLLGNGSGVNVWLHARTADGSLRAGRFTHVDPDTSE